jgi:hypothetical protein
LRDIRSNHITNTFAFPVIVCDIWLCEGIQDIVDNHIINLHPNPNHGTFTLESTQMEGATYTISNMLDQIIQQQGIHTDHQNIDMGAAPPGIYILSISGMEGLVKFAVMR